MKELVIFPKAAKQLAAMPGKDRTAMVKKFARLADGETDGLDIKKLQDREGYRLRHGIWRAIFIEDNIVVTIIKVGHRKDIY
jgi:mRNA interferase RelE/StbE